LRSAAAARENKKPRTKRRGRARLARRQEPFGSRLVSLATRRRLGGAVTSKGRPMNGLIYLVGLIVVIMAILSLFGLR
jgi:hypothetical protein